MYIQVITSEREYEYDIGEYFDSAPNGGDILRLDQIMVQTLNLDFAPGRYRVANREFDSEGALHLILEPLGGSGQAGVVL